MVRYNLFVTQDLSTFFSYHSRFFLLALIPRYLYFFQIFLIVFFPNKVNSIPGLKVNAIATLYFNSTNNTTYNYFPTLVWSLSNSLVTVQIKYGVVHSTKKTMQCWSLPRNRRQKRAKKILPQGKRFTKYSPTFNPFSCSQSVLLDLPILLGIRRKIHTRKNPGPKNTSEKKYWTQEIPAIKNCGATKYQPAYILGSRNKLTKYLREEILDPRNTHKKKLWTHEILARKYLGPKKAQWHDDARLTRLRKFSPLWTELTYLIVS